MLQALEQIRRMRGGAQSHLMRCSDGYYYVVKFQNNPQHRRILVNEMLGTKLAARLGLPTVPVAIVEVSEELIRLTPELAMELPRTRIACQPGLQFGARYPGDPRQVTLHDFLPDEQLREVENLHEFAGMLVFDKWTCNTNGRQTVFFDERKVERDEATVRYKTRMIDQGFASTTGMEFSGCAAARLVCPQPRLFGGSPGWSRLRPGWSFWKSGSASGCSTKSAGRFRRPGTKTITTRSCGCWNSFIAAGRACRTLFWRPKNRVASRFPTGCEP